MLGVICLFGLARDNFCVCACVCTYVRLDIMCLSSLCLAGLVCPGWPSNTAGIALIWRGTAPNMPQQPEKCVFEFVCMCDPGADPLFTTLCLSPLLCPTSNITQNTHMHKPPTHTRTEGKLQKPSHRTQSVPPPEPHSPLLSAYAVLCAAVPFVSVLKLSRWRAVTPRDWDKNLHVQRFPPIPSFFQFSGLRVGACCKC